MKTGMCTLKAEYVERGWGGGVGERWGRAEAGIEGGSGKGENERD